MRVIGIDPGLTCMGWGVVDVNGSKLTHVAHGTVKTDAKKMMSARLKVLYEELGKMLTLWQPQVAAIEETFMNNNAASAIKLGQARGVAMVAASVFGLEVYEYPALLIKKSIVGAGHAEKEQVQMMIKVLLPGVEASSDAADALAVAICHAHHGATKAKLGGIMSGGAR